MIKKKWIERENDLAERKQELEGIIAGNEELGVLIKQLTK